MAVLVIADPAREDIQRSYNWWRTHRDAAQAERWYHGIYDAVLSLRENPEQCAVVRETDLIPEDVRQLNFGVGSRPTHRIVFAFKDDTVTILRVRHAAQDDLTVDDIAT